MSDEPATSTESSSTPAANGAPRARRTSKPRPKKKAAKVAKVKEDLASAPAAPEPAAFPAFPETPDPTQSAAPPADWPEPEETGDVAAATQENPKRKRRRKKGKGSGQNSAPQTEEESPALVIEEPEDAPQTRPHQQRPSRPKLDPEMLAKCAWKIYLAEISEEGVALVGDNDAKELSRRCFRLAEIFMEEQARRR